MGGAAAGIAAGSSKRQREDREGVADQSIRRAHAQSRSRPVTSRSVTTSAVRASLPRKRSFVIGLGAAFVVLLAIAAYFTSGNNRMSALGGESITESALRKHVVALADTSLHGRATGTPGASLAAAYIEEQFGQAGLEPISEETGFRQTVDCFTNVRVEGVIGMRDLARGYEFNTDYTPLGLSSDGSYLGPIAFVGYGVTAPEYGYDDYASVDVTGKLVLAFLGEPGMNDPDSPFAGTDQTPHSDLYRKARVAKDHGAAGIVLVPGPLHSKDPERIWRISNSLAYYDSGILVAQVTVSAGTALVQPGGLDLRTLQAQIDETFRPASALVANQEVELAVRLGRTATQLINVVGKLPGRTDGGIAVLANYDGFGMGKDPSNPRVHPGANGNASGVAALIEVARNLGDSPNRATIYFAAVAGRQFGSAGAEALVREHVIPTDSLSCAMTLFALGIPTFTRLEIMGGGSGQGLTDVLETVNDRVSEPVELRLDARPANSGDHIPFARAKVPVLTIFGGAYDTYGTAADTPGGLLYPDFARNARFALAVVQDLSGRSERITFVD